jgi:hypothetical protein
MLHFDGERLGFALGGGTLFLGARERRPRLLLLAETFRKAHGQIGFEAAMAIDAGGHLAMPVEPLRSAFECAFGAAVFTAARAMCLVFGGVTNETLGGGHEARVSCRFAYHGVTSQLWACRLCITAVTGVRVCEDRRPRCLPGSNASCSRPVSSRRRDGSWLGAGTRPCSVGGGRGLALE